MWPPCVGYAPPVLAPSMYERRERERTVGLLQHTAHTQACCVVRSLAVLSPPLPGWAGTNAPPWMDGGEELGGAHSQITFPILCGAAAAAAQSTPAGHGEKRVVCAWRTPCVM